MNKWALLLSSAVAVGAAIVVVTLAMRRGEHAAELGDVPDLIADCFQRIQRIEADIQRLTSGPETSA
jgi:hypothetical protein